jgi:hypothetical protein
VPIPETSKRSLEGSGHGSERRACGEEATRGGSLCRVSGQGVAGDARDGDKRRGGEIWSVGSTSASSLPRTGGSRFDHCSFVRFPVLSRGAVRRRCRIYFTSTSPVFFI